MAERYSRVYTAKTDLYGIGSPVILSAGALLKDNQTDKVLVQLKIKSISEKKIKAAKVRIECFDTIGAPLGEETRYEYLDLDVARDAEFGQKTLIPLPNASTRAFMAKVTEVAFEDNSTWSNDSIELEPLPQKTTLLDKLKDAELVKQYGLRYGQTAVWPEKAADLWYCACGAINDMEEPSCHLCGNKIESLLACDLDALKAECDDRIAKEKAEREAKEAAERAVKEAAAKKTKKLLSIGLPLAAICIALILVMTKVVIPNNNYNKAVKFMESEQFDEAAVLFEKLGDYKDSAAQLDLAKHGKAYAEAYAKAEALLADGDKAHAAMAFGSIISYKDAKEKSFALWNEIAIRKTLCTSSTHVVALRENGTLLATRYLGDQEYNYGQGDIDSWNGIVAISTGSMHTVGLRANGTVVATGYNDYGQCETSEWENVVAISAGYYCTLGLKADGTVVAIGNNEYHQCDVSEWENIIGIAAGYQHSLGLRADGTVVATGRDLMGSCKDTTRWENVVAIGVGDGHSVGLLKNGKVVAAGINNISQCEVSDWDDIISISVGGYHTTGLRKDGTVVSTPFTGTGEWAIANYGQCVIPNWDNVSAVDAGYRHTVALHSDGTVSMTQNTNKDYPDDYDGKEISGWSNIKVPKQIVIELSKKTANAKTHFVITEEGKIQVVRG